MRKLLMGVAVVGLLAGAGTAIAQEKMTMGVSIPAVMRSSSNGSGGTIAEAGWQPA